MGKIFKLIFKKWSGNVLTEIRFYLLFCMVVKFGLIP